MTMERADLGTEVWLNLGCGRDIKQGYINIDCFPAPGVDKVLDLDSGDLTEMFSPATVDRILMSHVLEHLRDPFRTIRQAHEILKPGGVLEVRVPHRDHKNAYSIFHHHYFDEFSFRDITRSEGGLQNQALFDVDHIEVERRRDWGDPKTWLLGVRKEVRVKFRKE